jgi:hypothetical protein
MRPGRHPVLSYPKLRLIDAWFSQNKRNKSPPAKTMAIDLGISIKTLADAARRRRGYADCPLTR